MTTIDRRRVVAATAWTVPLVVVGSPAAWAACSGPVTTYTPALSISSSTTTKDVNGHTIGHFYFAIRNDGTTTLPAGTTYTVTITAEKSPGTTAKDVLVTPQTSPGITPTGTTRFNPSGTGGAVASKTYSVVLPAALPPGATFTADWFVDSETGVGATRLRLDARLVSYSTTSCGQTTAGTATSVTSYWGAK
ncbi:hypothetical protein [Phycicoccus flavus]|uniref:hypothetical protein n=1 Tax=Phycicoccus flavus TaxID=2502783 RepID=UPI000FEBDD01|nr:hypothetical protein [Phycicoccus flavus]NHA68378.1 hypothetical protein [Phycicoccus flavus]